MVNGTKIEPGYKLSRSGIIPDEWDVKLGKDLFTHRKQRGHDNLKVFSVTIKSGLIERSTLDRKMAPDISGDKSLLIEKGDLAYNMMRMWQGALGIAYAEGVVSPAYVVIRCGSTMNPIFAYYLLKSPRYLHLLKSYSYGITEDRLRLYFRDFGLISFPCPNLEEQKKIANIIGTYDKAIKINEDIIKTLKLRNEGLAQLLLTGKKRLKGFNMEWKKVRADKIFKSHSDKSHNGDLEVLSATQERGVIPRSSNNIDIKFDSSSLGTYKKVEIGDFVISLRSFQGGIEYSKYEGLVSPAYTVLKEIIPISKTFYRTYFKTETFINLLNTIIYGIRDGKQISYKDFSTLKLSYPSIDEQMAIAEVLQKAHKELELFEKKLNILQEQKKGLMQKLLTGEIRVKT